MVSKNKKIVLLNFFKEHNTYASQLIHLFRLEEPEEYLNEYFMINDRITPRLGHGLESYIEEEINFVLIQYKDWKNSFLLKEMGNLFSRNAS